MRLLCCFDLFFHRRFLHFPLNDTFSHFHMFYSTLHSNHLTTESSCHLLIYSSAFTCCRHHANKTPLSQSPNFPSFSLSSNYALVSPHSQYLCCLNCSLHSFFDGLIFVLSSYKRSGLLFCWICCYCRGIFCWRFCPCWY